MRYETKKLLEVYKEHGNIIVGVDFDDTVFPLSKDPYITIRAAEIRRLLKSIRKDIVLCLWTVANEFSMPYKVFIMEGFELTPDYINDSPVFKEEDIRKPFFNILLDDAAGLNEAIEILKEFKTEIQVVD